MNKGITLLILLVVLGAMGLVMYSHGNSGKPAPARPSTSPATAPADGAGQRNGYASPLQAPQGGVGLRPIEPPIGAAANADGVPRSVTLTAGGDPRTVRPVIPQRTEEQTPRVAVGPKTVGTPGQEQPSAQAKPQADERAAQAKPQAAEHPTQAKPQASSSSADQPKPPAQNKTENTEAPKPESRTPAAQSGTPGLTVGPTPWDAPKPDTPAQGQAQPGAAGAAVSEGAVTASLTPPAATPANPHQPPVTDPIVNERSLSKTGSHSLRSIHLGFAGQQMRMRIEAGDPFPVKTFALTNPDRLVVDLPGTWKDMKTPSVPDNSIVSKIRLGQQPDGPRLVLDLKGPAKNHTIERSGNRVDVMVR